MQTDTFEARPAGGLLLALDTAGPRCSAALYDMAGARILSAAEPEIGRGHAERLMDVIAEVLSGAEAGYADLARIAVTVGPGSFTGIRVGVSTGRALALALGVPCVGVSTLEALAEPHWRESAVLCVQDARRGEVYAALYGPGGTVLAAPTAIGPDRLADMLQIRPHEAGLSIVGSGASIAQARLSTGRWPVLDSSGDVAVAAVARLGAQASPGAAPRPAYLREADAKPPSAAPLFRPGSHPAPA